jgi:hypothetical protein
MNLETRLRGRPSNRWQDAGAPENGKELSLSAHVSRTNVRFVLAWNKECKYSVYNTFSLQLYVGESESKGNF